LPTSLADTERPPEPAGTEGRSFTASPPGHFPQQQAAFEAAQQPRALACTPLAAVQHGPSGQQAAPASQQSARALAWTPPQQADGGSQQSRPRAQQSDTGAVSTVAGAPARASPKATAMPPNNFNNMKLLR
jgi:hypothetical protein